MSENQKEVIRSIETRNASLLQKLIKPGGAAGKRDAKGRPLLVLAAEVGDPAIGEVLLDSGADINAATTQQETPLHVAVARKNEDFAIFLLQRGAIIECRNYQGKTPVHLMASLGLARLLKEVVESRSCFPTLDSERNFEVDLAVKNGHTELAYQLFRAAMRTFPPPEGQQKGPQAALLEFLSRFSYMLKRLAQDPEIKTWEGRGFHLLDLCLRYLPRNDYRFSLLELFLDTIDVTFEPIQSQQKITERSTDLLKESYCSIISHLRLQSTAAEQKLEPRDVGLLISCLPAIDRVEILQSAFRSGNVPTQEYLISQGIQRSISPAVKSQMLRAAHTFVEKFWDQMEVDFSYIDESGCNLLHMCMEDVYGDPRKTIWLVLNGVDPNLANVNGDTPLHLAARNSDARNIDALVSMGADPDIQDRLGLNCWAYAGREHACIENARLCMPLMNPESLGPKKIAWLVEHAQKFHSMTADNAPAAIQTWIHDFITQIYCPHCIVIEKRWGMFLASLAAMREYLSEDPQLPDKLSYRSDTDFSILQNAIITIGLRMGRWVASLQDSNDATPASPRWKFCRWQDSLAGIFYVWFRKNRLPPLVVQLEPEQDFFDLVDTDDTPPRRASLIVDRKEWLKSRFGSFYSEWQNSPELGSCITLVHDFVRRMYLEDNISNKDELADLIYQLFNALSLTPFLKTPRNPDQENDKTDAFTQLFFVLAPVAFGMLEHLRERPEEYLMRSYNMRGYNLGNKMFEIMDRWAIALRKEADSN